MWGGEYPDGAAHPAGAENRYMPLDDRLWCDIFSRMTTPDDLERLRGELHRLVDQAIDQYLPRPRPPSASPPTDRPPHEALVRRMDGVGEHSYRWPKNVESFERGTDYEASFSGRTLHVRVSWTKRECWGRNRRRAIVFGYVRGAPPSRPEPFAEFVETDEDPPRFAAPIRRPGGGKSYLKAGEAVPPELAGVPTARNDALFDGVDEGPALRAVFCADEEDAMIRFGLWIARLRRWI